MPSRRHVEIALASFILRQELWEKLFYFNTVTRISIYPRPSFAQNASQVLKTAGLCRCFDCSREVELLAAYLLQHRRVPVERLAGEVAQLARDVSVGCGRGPSGLLDAPQAHWELEAPKRRRTGRHGPRASHRQP